MIIQEKLIQIFSKIQYISVTIFLKRYRFNYFLYLHLLVQKVQLYKKLRLSILICIQTKNVFIFVLKLLIRLRKYYQGKKVYILKMF